MLGAQSQIVSAAIDPQRYVLAYPGSSDEPGHRSIPAQDHLDAAADTQQGITTLTYNFKDAYGLDPDGRVLFNLITERADGLRPRRL